MIKTKFLSVVLCLCMILSCLSISVMAQPTLELGNFDYSNIKISVSVNTDTSLPEAMVYVSKNDTNALSDANPPVYMDFVSLTNGGVSNKEILFPLNLTYGSYIVSVYYDDASSPLTAEFNYYNPDELLVIRKNEILEEAKQAALIDATALSDAMFDIDSAGGTKLPTNDTIINSSIDLSVYNTVENKLEVYNRMIDKDIPSLETFDRFVELFLECSTEQKESETRNPVVVPSNPSTDNTKPGENTGSITVSRPGSSSGGSGFGGGNAGAGGATTPVPPTGVAKVEFTDMTNHWAQKYSSELAAKGIINGYEDGTFKPQNNVTRAEITKMLVGGFDISGTNTVSFSDVPQSAWYSDFVKKASAAGIINGYNGKFNPTGQITRQDAALMVYRVLASMGKISQGTAEFKDASAVSAYALDAVKALGTAKIITGDTNGNFNPASPITRAEVAAIICRAISLAQSN